MNQSENIFIPMPGKRAFEEVSSRIKKLVFQGLLKPGDKLPPESDLAKKFNVSRQTIREALRILELSGFIEVQQGYGGGSFIKDTTLSKMGHLFLDTIRLERITIEELTVARLENERAILNHAIDSADETDIAALRENIEQAKKIIKNNLMATDLNFEFHKLLAKATKNNVLVILMELVLVALSQVVARTTPDLETTASAIRYHEKILQAMTEKDRAGALKLLEAHLKEVQGQLSKSPEAFKISA